jgi:hypothetical protein
MHFFAQQKCGVDLSKDWQGGPAALLFPPIPFGAQWRRLHRSGYRSADQARTRFSHCKHNFSTRCTIRSGDPLVFTRAN